MDFLDNMKNKKYILICAVALFSLFKIDTALAFNLPKGISFNNIDLSGLSIQEADKIINEKYNELNNKKIDLKIDTKILSLNYLDVVDILSNKAEDIEALRKYVDSNVIKRYLYKKELEKNNKNISIDLKVNENKFKADINKSYPELEEISNPIDAKISRENGKFIIVDGKAAIKPDIIKAAKLLDEDLKNNVDNINITVPLSKEEPKIKANDLKQIKDLLGTYTTAFKTSSNSRATNISVGTKKINGTILMPGELLSGYHLLSPFTKANGYETAGAYENGRVVDNVGGGVCQISTTLYNSAIRAELDIEQRNNHSMTVSYVPASCDSAIAGTVKDLKIKNNYDFPIYIEGIVNGRTVCFNIWGKEIRPKNRTIEFVPEVISEIPMKDIIQEDPNLPLGQEIKVASGHNGRLSKLWKIVKIDGIEKEKSLISSDKYMVSNNIIKRGTKPVENPAVLNNENIVNETTSEAKPEGEQKNTADSWDNKNPSSNNEVKGPDSNIVETVESLQ